MAGGLPKWVVLKDRPSDRHRIGFCKNWQCSIRQGWLQRNTMQHGWIALNSPTMWAKADLLVEHNELNGRAKITPTIYTRLAKRISLYANHQEYHLQVYAVFEQMLADPIFPKHDFMMHMLETTRETQLKLCCWSSLWEELYENCPPDGTCCRTCPC